MEHISRGILPQVDVILLVSDCSTRGLQAVGRIRELLKALS
jgi:CO dehydrogenase maturation factor